MSCQCIFEEVTCKKDDKQVLEEGITCKDLCVDVKDEAECTVVNREEMPEEGEEATGAEEEKPVEETEETEESETEEPMAEETEEKDMETDEEK